MEKKYGGATCAAFFVAALTKGFLFRIFKS